MADKVVANVKWILIIHWCIKLVMIGALSGILIAWVIDRLNYNNFQNDSVIMKLRSSGNLLQSFKDLYFPNISLEPYSKYSRATDLDMTIQGFDKIDAIHASNIPSELISNSNYSQQVSANLSADSPTTMTTIVPWISSELEAYNSSHVVDRRLAPGGNHCNNSKTVDVRIPSLDGNSNIKMSTGDVHDFILQALDDSGVPVCSAGDYFETDLSGEKWKSRPPVKDVGNGSYKFSLQVHPDFTGEYNLTIILLFRHWEGLKSCPEELALDKILRVIPIKFHESKSQLPEIRQCKKSDYSKNVWSGRWTRHARNVTCPISDDGRYRCQEPSFPCQHPWCDGPLGALESNGWIYSTHCSFKMFNNEEAWNCLNNRWIFWWGDSNHCDTIRNILHFILDVSDMNIVPRMFDRTIANPRNPFQMVKFTSIFNGHPNLTLGNYQGLNSLTSENYRQLLKGFFSQNVIPDTVIMNSGLHDGFYWSSIRSYIKGADYAAAFWAEVMEGIKQRGLGRPEIIYRTTVATAGSARKLGYNPQKMEAFNGVLLDKLRQYGVLDRVVDDFDMTFPWHYDNRCNDGIHYGRAPWKMTWKDGKIGHQYFVDLMLCHVLLNALCLR